jgi:secreted Zn-dependent insulinase-like peptidase
MEQMTDEAFEKHKTALVAIKLQKDKTLYDESDRHWETIQSERYEFAHRETVAQEVRTVQLAELRQWYAEHLAPGGEKRRQLLVAVYGKQHKLPEASTELVDSDSQLDIWKRAQYCHPPVVRKAPIKK